MLAEVVIYTAMMCSYCDRAKDLLKTKGVQYQEISVMNSAKVREEMIKRSGGRKTVPQIFINGQHVGGFDDLRALESSGKLDALLRKNKTSPKNKQAAKPVAPPKPSSGGLNNKLKPVKAVKPTDTPPSDTTV